MGAPRLADRIRKQAPALQTADPAAAATVVAVPQGVVSLFDADGALTREYLAARGYCCGNGCRNCPYPPGEAPAPTSAA